MPIRRQLHIVCQNRDRLGESVLWHPEEQALYWIDFYEPAVRRWTPGADVPQSFRLGKSKTIGALAFGMVGRLLVVLDEGVHWFDKESGGLELFADPNQHRDGVSYNDAKVDRQGRLWVGTYDMEERDPRGVLYRVDGLGQAALADSGFVVSNGPAFSPDGAILYFSDTVGRQLLAYRLDAETGRLSERRQFAALDDAGGVPDGLCVDCEGGVWCAIYGGARVLHFTPGGQIDQVIEVPPANVTSCCLGGDDLRMLFIASGEGPANRAPDLIHDGALLAVAVEVPGVPEPQFSERR
jgi:sugar lactone lactonase YvrE